MQSASIIWQIQELNQILIGSVMNTFYQQTLNESYVTQFQ